MAGGGSGGGSSTQTVVQQIPAWQQGYAQQNEDIAASLASRPYQNYQGQTVAGFTDQQQQGMDMAGQAATAYQPDLNQANQLTQSGSQTWGQATPQQQAAYMNPYVMQSLAPQLQQLQIQQGQNQLGIDKQSTQAGAYGDARQGVAQSLNDFYGQLAQNDLIGQGYNTAYNNAQTAYNQGAAQQLSAGQQFGQLAQQAQDQGVAGSNALFNSGTQQQQLNQQQLTQSYNNFMNQVNYPTEQLNMRIAALANSPYTVSNQTSLAPANASATNLGAFGALAGGIGSLVNGSSKGASSIFNGIPSDIRVKRNIKHVGFTDELKLPVYKFNYVWDDASEHIGVMAQDVEQVLPEAVMIAPSGMKLVNYDMVR